MFPVSLIQKLNPIFPPVISNQVLNLPKDTYEDYLAFLLESNDETNSGNHLIYLQKKVFDSIIETSHDEKLTILQQKEDITFYNTGRISHIEYIHTIGELFAFYNLTQDEILFIQEIQQIIKEALLQQVSPFTYLEACKELFSQKLQLKLIDILKFMIGDSLCYKMNPASIFGLCLKWTISKYGITRQIITELIGYLIDINSSQIGKKLEKLTQMMSQIMKINETQ